MTQRLKYGLVMSSVEKWFLQLKAGPNSTSTGFTFLALDQASPEVG